MSSKMAHKRRVANDRNVCIQFWCTAASRHPSHIDDVLHTHGNAVKQPSGRVPVRSIRVTARGCCGDVCPRLDNAVLLVDAIEKGIDVSANGQIATLDGTPRFRGAHTPRFRNGPCFADHLHLTVPLSRERLNEQLYPTSLSAYWA